MFPPVPQMRIPLRIAAGTWVHALELETARSVEVLEQLFAEAGQAGSSLLQHRRAGLRPALAVVAQPVHSKFLRGPTLRHIGVPSCAVVSSRVSCLFSSGG